MPLTKTIEDAAYAKAGAVATAVSLPITYNEPGFEVPNTPYIECRLAVGSPLRIFIGQGPHDRLYTLQLTVTAREGHSQSALAAWAGDIAEEFAVDEVFPVDAPLLRVMEAPHVDGLLHGEGRSIRQVRVRMQALT